MIRGIVVASGLASVLILLGATIAGGMAYPNYDHARQFISELGATGAPTQAWVSAAFMVSGGLLIAFWLGVVAYLPRTPLLVVGALLAAGNGLGLMIAGVFSCDFECPHEGQSPAAVRHDLSGGLGYGAAIVALPILAVAARRWPMGRTMTVLGGCCAVAALVGFGGVVSEVEFKGLMQRLLETAIAVFMLGTAWSVLEVRPRP